MPIESIGTPGLWLGFAIVVLSCLTLDLGVFQRKPHTLGHREAFLWSAVWIGLGLLFNLFILYRFGHQRALEFLTGFLIEKALSIDNLFIFVLIFSVFAVPDRLHHRVLFWGVFGAFVMRGLFIGLGAALIQNFHWILYVFGAFLVYTAVRLIVHGEPNPQPNENPMVRCFRRFVPVTRDYHEGRFCARVDGRWYATPLLVVLVAIEASDVLFAVDSIPAVFAVTEDPFIVYTSNVFAILGLRALYFLLAGVIRRFHYLRFGLAAVLAFVGVKMLIESVYPVPVIASFAAVCVFLGLSMIASVVLPPAGSGNGPTPGP